MDINSLSHTKWNCKYHIVFAPKYRRKVAYGKMKQDIANILSMLCKRKGVEIVEAEICPDHVHMLVKIPPSLSVSSFVGYLKGKSTLMIFERHANDIAVESSKLMAKYDAIIWAHYGIFCSGEDFDNTFGLMHTIEKAAAILLKVLAVRPDKLQTITPDNFRSLAKDFNVDLKEEFLYDK